ncbi:transcriptional regulator with XRE-family HTH domain [Xanthomonas translucens]
MAHLIDGPNPDFALRVLERRRAKNLTQQELAEAAGVDKRSISMYENGRMFPRAEVIRRLARVLDVEDFWLASGNSSALHAYLGNQTVSQVLPRLQYLFIQSWDQVDAAGAVRLPQYRPDASGEVAHSKFFPFLSTTLETIMAAEFPGSHDACTEYPAGTIVVFRATPVAVERLASGTDLIYRKRGAGNPVGLRRLIRDPGISNPVLVPFQLGSSLPPLELDEVELEVIGVVIARFIRHSA